MTAPDAPRCCSECAYTPKCVDVDAAAYLYCRRHKIPRKATANPCAFAKPRTVPKPGQGQQTQARFDS